MRQDTGAVNARPRRGRQPAMHTDLLVKLQISLILQGGLPVAGGTPCDFLDMVVCVTITAALLVLDMLFRAHWHETMASGKARRLTCEGGFKG